MAHPFISRSRIAALLTAGSALLAQGTQTASMTLQTVDKSGKAVVGAQVILTSPAMQGERRLVTDESGRAVARLLPPGQYRIVLQKTGYLSMTLNQRIGLEQTYSPRVVMATPAEAVVEVVASSVGADKTESKTAYNFTKETIDNLPTARNTLDIAYLTPGVAKSVNDDKGDVEIRGSQGTGNLILVDGQNTMDNLYMGQRVGIIFDAVEETQILTGAIPAEYGYVEGGVVNSITKSGGNDFSASLRWDLDNPKWNAVRPMQSRLSIPNHISQERSLTVGGPIIKDKLWFFAAGFDRHPQTPKALDGTLADLPSVDYTEVQDDYRRELKLTYSPTSDNTITVTYNNSSLAWNRDVAGAGELAAITLSKQTGEFWGASWRSILSENLTFNLRIGGKSQELGNSALNPLAYGPPIFNYEDNQQYVAEAFDALDPKPDKRTNQTANLKVSYFWNRLGNHETDFGYDYYLGQTEASGYQSPAYVDVPGIGHLNVWVYNADHLDVPAREAWFDDTGNNVAGDGLLQAEKYVPDKATLTTHGFYVNDKWTLNTRVLFNLGLRYDAYEAKNQSQGKISSAGTFSPRLGVKFDVLGDASWVLGLSYSKLQGRPLETQFQQGGYVNNAIEYDFPFRLPAGDPTTYDPNHFVPIHYTFAQLWDLANYDTRPGHYGVKDAAYNFKFDPHLKPQMVDEWQGTLAYNFKDTPVGDGYVRATLVSKDWHHLVDYSTGPAGAVQDPYGNWLDINYYHSEPWAQRSYKALELDAAVNRGPLRLQGNITWSELYGNYAGEARSQPGKGEQMQNYNILPTYTDVGGHAVASHTVYDYRIWAPTGRLVVNDGITGLSPLTIHGMADYTLVSFLGKTTIGVVYTFNSGLPYDEYRYVNLAGVYPELVQYADATGASRARSIQAKQFLGNRGSGVFNSTSSLDLAVTQDFQIWKARSGRSVDAFTRVSITNFFNHQQQRTWNIVYANTSDPNSPFTPASPEVFGKATSSQDYVDPRILKLSFGIKF